MAGAVPWLTALVTATCVDFVEPELPNRGAPALIEATIRLSDMGTAEIDARLVPGLDQDGMLRSVTRDSVFVLGLATGPDTLLRDGTRRYVEAWSVPEQALVEPVMFRAPQVLGVAASPPSIDWTGVRRLDPDTIVAVRGEDVFLTISVGAVAPAPPDLEQWFLRFEGDEGAFNISADGPPPDIIQVPARWIPAGSEIAVRLIRTQSAVISAGPGDYVGVIVLDTRLHWTLRMNEAGTGPTS